MRESSLEKKGMLEGSIISERLSIKIGELPSRRRRGTLLFFYKKEVNCIPPEKEDSGDEIEPFNKEKIWDGRSASRREG